MRIRLFHKQFIFFAILALLLEITANDLSDIELEKRCNKRERLLDEKDDEPLSNIKVHRNYLDGLLKQMKLNAANVRNFMNF